MTRRHLLAENTTPGRAVHSKDQKNDVTRPWPTNACSDERAVARARRRPPRRRRSPANPATRPEAVVVRLQASPSASFRESARPGRTALASRRPRSPWSWRGRFAFVVASAFAALALSGTRAAAAPPGPPTEGPATARAQHLTALLTDARARGFWPEAPLAAGRLLHTGLPSLRRLGRSEADGEGFRLAGPAGAGTDPRAELDETTLLALLAPRSWPHHRGGGPPGVTPEADPDHAQCRFPARGGGRAGTVAALVSLRAPRRSTAPCFQQWQTAPSPAAQAATLAMQGLYQQPRFKYGHTFLRPRAPTVKGIPCSTTPSPSPPRSTRRTASFTRKRGLRGVSGACTT